MFIHPELLSDQQRSIEIMEKPLKDIEKMQKDLKYYFKQIDTENIGVVTRP